MSMERGVLAVVRRPPGERRIDIGPLAGPLGLTVASSKLGSCSGVCAPLVAQETTVSATTSAFFIQIEFRDFVAKTGRLKAAPTY
jgi:hypothetical protein